MPQSLNDPVINILPFVEINGSWNLDDELLIGVYHKLHADKTYNNVFYDAKTNTPEEFISLLKSRGTLPIFIMVDGYIRALAWINDLHNNHATAHFCGFKESWGKCSQLMGKAAIDYWFGFKMEDGSPRFDLLLGVTPEPYHQVLKYIESIGFKVIGKVPKILYNGHTNSRIAAVLSYCERPQ